MPSDDVVADLRPRLSGTVMFIGATDTGKTTLAWRAYQALADEGQSVAYLDCDVGQSSVGPPATIGLQCRGEDGGESRHLFFVGDNSPRGHFLPMVVGTRALRDLALRRGCRTVIVDTTGLIAPTAGGVTLKLWKAEALRPDAIVALQRQDELRPLLTGLRSAGDGGPVLLSPSPQTRVRSPRDRAAYRRDLWRDYLAGARRARLPLGDLPVWDVELARPGRVVSLDDADGLTMSLGVVLSWSPRAAELLLPAPPGDVRRLRLGRIGVDPRTGQESWGSH